MLRSLRSNLPHLTLIFLLLFVPPTFAQLSFDDIESLQARAQAEDWSFEVGENAATQYSLDQLCGLVEPVDWQKNANFRSFTIKVTLPERFDWREEAGGLPPVRNQGSCGSCWAFATVGPLECNIFIQDGETVDLSEQWLVSCNRSGWGCDGGWWAHAYHQNANDRCDSSGAVLESDYPYTASDTPCSCPDPHPHRIQGWGYIGSGSGIPANEEIKQAIMQYGPVAVSVYVNAAFQSYNSGYFNLCGSGNVNHGVVLVGWDDTVGASGAWILRNSWGPGWGMDGYMYIAYGCSSVGYGATYVDYVGGVTFEADVQHGWAPVDVNFSASSGLDVTDWNWDFGDGTVGIGQQTSHTYTQPGTFDVTIEATVGPDLRTREKKNCVMVLADTIKAAAGGGVCNSTASIPIYLRNNAPVRYLQIPIVYDGPVDVRLDSVSTVGCRTEYFEVVQQIHSDAAHNRKSYQLVCSNYGTAPYLEVGEGPVLEVFFSIPSQNSYGEVTSIDLSGYLDYQPKASWPLLDWNLVPESGTVTLAVTRGDCDGSAGITVGDLTYIVSYLFSGGMPPYPDGAGDVDCSSSMDVNDVVYMVNYLFQGGPEPMMCF